MKNILLSTLSLLFLLSTTAHASPLKLNGPLWQLTVRYDLNSIEVTSAKRILGTSNSRKQISSPGLPGALMTIPATVEWLDTKNRVLRRASTEIPLGQRAIQTDFTDQPRGLYRVRLPDYSKTSRRVRCGR
jgi:hypothetical protein